MASLSERSPGVRFDDGCLVITYPDVEHRFSYEVLEDLRRHHGMNIYDVLTRIAKDRADPTGWTGSPFPELVDT